MQARRRAPPPTSTPNQAPRPPPNGPPPPSRPRIALVLSGGGARGFAHIGVLREQRVSVDMVVGVSMGAVVGGAWAAGRSVDELERLVRLSDWASVVADRPPRTELAFRRREEDLLLPLGACRAWGRARAGESFGAGLDAGCACGQATQRVGNDAWR